MECVGPCNLIAACFVTRTNSLAQKPDFISGNVSEFNSDVFRNYLGCVNSLTTIGPYMAHRFFWALFKVNNFLNFCPLTTFDTSKRS